MKVRPSHNDLQAYCRLSGVFGAVTHYGDGSRADWVLDTLAEAKVLFSNLGKYVPCPDTIPREDWEVILCNLVLSRLGNHRCLNCRRYFRSKGYGKAVAGLNGNLIVHQCPGCYSTITEPIGCVEELSTTGGGK